MARPSHVLVSFAGGSSARVRLLWDEAPKTISALLSMCDPTKKSFEVGALHARHSGAEAIFITPSVLRDVGDENQEPAPRCGDFLFGYEPKGICAHGCRRWLGHELKCRAAALHAWKLNHSVPCCAPLIAAGNHAHEDVSEVAWLYHDACVPRRWVSVDGDPTNQRGPFKTVDVALNKWGKVEGDAAAFYAESGALPKTGMKTMIFSIEDA